MAAPYATLSRAEARDYYLDTFAPVAEVAPSWAGSVVDGEAGTLGSEYLNAILARFNAYRYMAGLPDNVTLDITFNQRAQAAALMMSANRALSHNPPTTWTYYTAEGAQGAGSSNLFLGASGTDAIDGYVSEGAPAGHRRWILYPPQQRTGFGDIPTPDGGYPTSNATYVIGGGGARPAVPYVAWPPSGYLPWRLVPDAWSFAVGAGTDFATATVTVRSGGVVVPTTIQSRGHNFGDPAIEWTVSDATRTPPAADASYEVTIGHVGIGGGQFRDYIYTTTVFDPAPTSFEFTTDWGWSFEMAGTASFTVERQGDTSTAASVAYHTIDDTARAGQDYTAAQGTLNFAPGVTSRSISVALTNDGVDETYWEGFRIALSDPSRGSELGARTSSSWTIGDNDGVFAWLGFRVTSAVVAEGGGSVLLEVTRGGNAPNADISVAYTTQDGTARAGEDYAATSGTLRFAPGVVSWTFTVPIASDNNYDPNEMFRVILSNPTGGAHLGEYDTNAATASVTINDDDPAEPTLGLALGAVRVDEDTGTINIEVIRGGVAPTGEITIAYATAPRTALAGSDFATTAGVLHFAPDQTSQTIAVPIVNDADHEPAESFTLTLNSPTGGAVLGGITTAVMTIDDDDTHPDPPAVGFTVAATSLRESDGGVTLTVARQGDPNADVSVTYSTTEGTARAGLDFTATAGTLRFAPGQITRTVFVRFVNDADHEADESFALVLSNPTGGAVLRGVVVSTVAILDDDPERSIVSLVQTSLVVDESAHTITLEVVRNGGLTGAVGVFFATVPGTAWAGFDHEAASGVVSFAPGETTKLIHVPLLDDSLHEADETFIVVLGTASGAELGSAIVVVTIRDNDPRPPRLLTVRGVRKRAGLSEVVAEFTSTLETLAASNRSAYVLRRAGRDKRFGTRDDRVLAFSRASYNPQTNLVTLRLARPFKPREPLQFVAKSLSLFAPRGVALDGDDDGVPGGDGVRILPV